MRRIIFAKCEARYPLCCMRPRTGLRPERHSMSSLDHVRCLLELSIHGTTDDSNRPVLTHHRPDESAVSLSPQSRPRLRPRPHGHRARLPAKSRSHQSQRPRRTYCFLASQLRPLPAQGKQDISCVTWRPVASPLARSVRPRTSRHQAPRQATCRADRRVSGVLLAVLQ